MAEYIIKLPTEKIPLEQMCLPMDKITGKLVRCKDCKYSVDLGEKNILGTPLLACRVGGVYSDQRLKHPEGYCDEGKCKD